MNIEADALRHDDLKQLSVFTGNVVLTKGTITIRAGQIEVRQDPQGYQHGVATAEAGKLASFRQKRDVVDEYIEGEAARIEYDGKGDTVKFIHQAVIRRYKGTVLSDETAGSVISYDNSRDVFTVQGDGNGASSANPSGRVRTMLSPRESASAPAASTPDSSTPTPVLKPSTGLGDKR